MSAAPTFPCPVRREIPCLFTYIYDLFASFGTTSVRIIWQGLFDCEHAESGKAYFSEQISVSV